MKISVSDIKQYDFCPRAIYLRQVLDLKPVHTDEMFKGLIGHAIRKELSLRQTKLLRRIEDVSEIKPSLEDELGYVIKECPAIYRAMLREISSDSYRDYVSVIRSEILVEISIISEKLRVMVEEGGLENALRKVTPWRVEYPVESADLMLSGRIDKVMVNDHYLPVEIKTGSVPGDVWNGDRLQICAYVMLLEERLGLQEPIPYGLVEYTRVQEKRPIMASESLRRRVLNTRDDIIGILDGNIPDVCPHGNKKKCESCSYENQCYNL